MGGSMASWGGPLGTHWWALGDPGPWGFSGPWGPIGPWVPGPLGTHLPLGTRALGDPLALGTRAGSSSTSSVRLERPARPVPVPSGSGYSVPYSNRFFHVIFTNSSFKSPAKSWAEKRLEKIVRPAAGNHSFDCLPESPLKGNSTKNIMYVHDHYMIYVFII